MTVRSILSSKGNDVVTAGPASSVAEIANILADRKIGAIVMTDCAIHVVGIISERDVVRVIARRGAEILQE
ncbi:MAG: CBS domain-containing protein, partial [Flavobacteriaceae bacterium]